MTHLSEDRVKDLFRDIEGRIKRGNPNPIRYLKNLHPSKDEIEGLEWRYRLSGYLEGLAVSDQMDNGFIELLVATLFSRADVSDGDRPGRARPFSIDIVTEQRKTFSFDVPAMNPLDAYVQLTKRTAYKSIPGIEVIKVFEGLLPDRTSGVQPLRTFHTGELIFTS
jgi:hypothetical protein